MGDNVVWDKFRQAASDVRGDPVARKREPPHDGGSGGGGDMTELERRVGKLEERVESVHTDLGGIRERLASIEGKISNMPTTFQMATWFVGVAIGLVGLTFAIARIMAQ